MKSVRMGTYASMCRVAPYRGAWIEICARSSGTPKYHVAPYRGAWIEMDIRCVTCATLVVAPYRGAWIEIKTPKTPEITP